MAPLVLNGADIGLRPGRLTILIAFFGSLRGGNFTKVRHPRFESSNEEAISQRRLLVFDLNQTANAQKLGHLFVKVCSDEHELM